MSEVVKRQIRYQTVRLFMPDGITSLRRSVELFSDMAYCTGVSVTVYDGNSTDAVLTLTDGVVRILNPTPLVFFDDSLYKGFVPLQFVARGRRVDINLERTVEQSEVYVDVMFLLENKPVESYEFMYRHIRYRPTPDPIQRTPLFNLPREYKYVNGIWIRDRYYQGGSMYNIDRPGWSVELRSQSDELLLDAIPLSHMRRFSDNLNGQFYPVNIRAGQDIYATLYNRNDMYYADERLDVVFLLSDREGGV